MLHKSQYSFSIAPDVRSTFTRVNVRAPLRSSPRGSHRLSCRKSPVCSLVGAAFSGLPVIVQGPSTRKGAANLRVDVVGDWRGARTRRK
jgi:hypothetical protein